MTFSTFCNELLLALYREGQEGADTISFGKVVSKYGIEAQRSWLPRAHEYLQNKGLVTGNRHYGNPEATFGGLTGEGLMFVEENLLTLDGDNLPQPVELVASDLVTEGPELGTPTLTVDSSTWTGLPKTGVLQSAAAQTIIKLAFDAEIQLDRTDASNSDKAQMRAYLLAIRTLADAPAPPADIIWHLIARAADITSLAMTVAALVGLFT